MITLRHALAGASQGGKGAGAPHDGKLMTEEERDEGKVGWHVYRAYVREGGPLLALLILAIICGGEVMNQLQQARASARPAYTDGSARGTAMRAQRSCFGAA